MQYVEHCFELFGLYLIGEFISLYAVRKISDFIGICVAFGQSDAAVIGVAAVGYRSYNIAVLLKYLEHTVFPKRHSLFKLEAEIGGKRIGRIEP